jgi:hypothetical protein
MATERRAGLHAIGSGTTIREHHHEGGERRKDRSSISIRGTHQWRTYNNRQFRLVSYVRLGAGWIPAADIRESAEGVVTLTLIDDATRPFATPKETNHTALAMAIAWMNSN